MSFLSGASTLSEDNSATSSPFKFDSESSLIMDMILEDDEHDFAAQLPNKFAEYIGSSLGGPKPWWGGSPAEKMGFVGSVVPGGGVGKAPYLKPQNSGSGTINWGPPPPPS